ncbi:MAG: hypothetical protein ACR2K5_07360 [Pseudolabrys sp.]
MIKAIGILALAIPLASSHAARADECGDAVRDYNTVLSSLSDALEQFRSCVADSKGLDDCNKPFARLRSTHGQFASVVAVYSKQCETKHG